MPSTAMLKTLDIVKMLVTVYVLPFLEGKAVSIRI